MDYKNRQVKEPLTVEDFIGAICFVLLLLLLLFI